MELVLIFCFNLHVVCIKHVFLSLPKLSTRTPLTVLRRQNSSRHRFSSLLDFLLRQVYSALLTSLLCRTLTSPVQLYRNLFFLRYFPCLAASPSTKWLPSWFPHVKTDPQAMCPLSDRSGGLFQQRFLATELEMMRVALSGNYGLV